MKLIWILILLLLTGCGTKNVGLSKRPAETPEYTFVKTGSMFSNEIYMQERFGGRSVVLTKDELKRAKKLNPVALRAYGKRLFKERQTIILEQKK